MLRSARKPSELFDRIVAKVEHDRPAERSPKDGSRQSGIDERRGLTMSGTKNKGGRPAYQPDERTRRQVETMCGFGIPVAEVAKVVGICENTLRKYYPDEIVLGATKADAKVAEALFKKAIGDGQGSVAAAIFWMKTRRGWRETNVTEISGPQGGPVVTEQISAAEVVSMRLAAMAAQYREGRDEAAALPSVTGADDATRCSRAPLAIEPPSENKR